MDLIYNDDEGYKLIDEMAHDVWSPEGPTLVEPIVDFGTITQDLTTKIDTMTFPLPVTLRE